MTTQGKQPVDQPSPAEKKATRVNTPEARSNIQAIIDQLQPVITPAGMQLSIPYQDTTVSYPTRVKKGLPDLAREHVSRLYEDAYKQPMSTMAYRRVLREMLTASPDAAVVIPDDIELVTGTIDVYISRSQQRIYQRRGKADSPYYICIFPDMPTVTQVSYSPTAHKGITQYTVTIAGVTCLLTSEDMLSGKWRDKYPRLQGVGNFHTSGIYVQVLQHLAHTAPMVHNVTHTGIHCVESEDGPVYGYMTDNGLFITGKTPYTGSIDYAGKATGETLARWETYEQIAADWNKQQAIAAIHYVQQLTPADGQALVTLAHHVRSMTRSIRSSTFRTGYSLYLYGKGGQGKTSLAITTASVGKPYLYPDGIDCTFRSTVTSIESKIDQTGDRPFIIDDLHKAPDDTAYDIKARERTLDALVRSATDGSAIRERMNSNMTMQRSNTVKTYPTVSGEYFPVTMATSFMRRTLFVPIGENCIPRKAKGTAVSLEHASNYTPGLHKLGRRVVVSLLDALNTHGIDQVAALFSKKHSSYYSELYDQVVSMWEENGYQEVPPYLDSILDAAANVLLGGYLIDKMTGSACSVVDQLRGYLVRIVYSQLLVMAGVVRIDGYTPLDQAIQELFTCISEEKRVNNTLLSAEDYTKAHTAPILIIPLPDGNGIVIPPTQWLPNGYKADKQIAAYIHKDRNVCYLTSAGRDALLSIAKEIEGLELVKSATALGKQLNFEKWLADRNNKNLTVPCNPQSKSQIRCYPLSITRLLELLFDASAFETTPADTIGASPNTSPNTSPKSSVPADMSLDAVLSIL